MIEKITLPRDLRVASGVPFPIADYFAHRLVRGKREQRVDVVGHKKEETREPPTGVVVMGDRIEKQLRLRWLRQLRSVADCAVNRDKK